jgi:hypothetical protein
MRVFLDGNLGDKGCFKNSEGRGIADSDSVSIQNGYGLVR